MELEPFKKGLVELLQQVVLPIAIVFLGLIWLLGTTFLWAFFLFSLGSFFLVQILFFLHYRPAWLRWIEQLKTFRTPIRITYFTVSFLLLIASLVWAISWSHSARFCIIVFGAYVTIAWIIYRIIASNILLYAYLLQTDDFNVNYWFFAPTHYSKNINHPNFAKRTIAWFIDGLLYYKKVSPIDQLKAIDIMFRCKFYESLIELQYSFFRLFSNQEMNFDFQKRVLRSIHELQNILKVQNFKLQEKQAEQLRFFESIKIWQVNLVLSAELLDYWFNLAASSEQEPEKGIHYLLVQNLYNHIGNELSKLIENPKDYHLDTKANEALKDPTTIQKANEILAKIPFSEDSQIGQNIRYVYSLIFAHNKY